MQSLQPHQMAAGTATICDLCDPYPGFSMQHQLVRVEEYVISTLIPLNACQLLHGCTYGKQKQHFPNYGRHHDYVELHGRLKLQVLNSKHIGHHREQRLHVVTVELNGDMECEQIL
jgi:hypothetical protein